LYLGSGVWPSPATAGSAFSQRVGRVERQAMSDVAAPEDGRTPLNACEDFVAAVQNLPVFPTVHAK